MRNTPPRERREYGAPRPKAHDFGQRRLGVLYEISKMLTHFVETVEQTVLALLAILTRELPLRSVVLIELTMDRPITIVWHASNIDADELRSAEARALKSFHYFMKTTGAPLKSLEPSADILLPRLADGAAFTAATPGKFITCPLIIEGHHIFGVLHLEGDAVFSEDDIRFITAIANQLAIALDLYRSRLNEIALLKEAQASRKAAEREVTSRRGMEAEVRKLNAELESRISERTSQFQDTIKQLDSFSYSIAHDLRAPLRHMYGFSKLLLESAHDDVSKTYARRVMAASEGMDVLIRDLLAYSRLTLEEVKHEPISLSPVLKLIKAGMSLELHESKARLEIAASLPRVLGHEPSLIQVITNLISNAIKFAAPGAAPVIRVKGELLEDKARLWVEDDGIGIAPEHQERIFGVFQRLHRAEEYPGTGIGLAIVRRAMERMKGRAGVESAPGRGSRFWIELDRPQEDR